MKFRLLFAALAVVLVGGLFAGSRVGTVQAATAGPDLRLSCPAIVQQGANFSCKVGWGASSGNNPTGYQFVIIYDSPGPPTNNGGVFLNPPAGTEMTLRSPYAVVGTTELYSPGTMWESAPLAGDGAEFCPGTAATSQNQTSPLLPAGYLGSGFGCVKTGGGPATLYNLDVVSFNFKASATAIGFSPVHMVTLAGGGATFGSYTILSGPQTNNYTCVNDAAAPARAGTTGSAYAATFFPTMTFPAGVNCAATGAIFGTPGQSDSWIDFVQAPPDVTVTKVGSAASVVQGQAYSYTITVTNTSATTTAPNVNVTDTLPAAFTATTVVPSAGTCASANTAFPCALGNMLPGAVVTITVTGTMTGGSGTTVQNCASETNASVPADPAPANNTNVCFSTQVIPPAVSWLKVADSTQTFLCEAGTIGVQGCTADGKNGTFSFEEVLQNQGDPNGLGAFEFTLHFDNLIFDPPVLTTGPITGTSSQVSVQDAITLLLTPALAETNDVINPAQGSGRATVSCSMSIPLETQIHVACASTGTIGSGPKWIGPRDMADVQLKIKDSVRGALFPHKENGIVSRVDDTGTEAANTCGWPLNDGTGYVVPGQTTECQGTPLLGILPGGLIADSHAFITIRRLEGDVTKDCSVTVADMQAEATRYGFSFGSLLYNIWYDLEPHTTGADGDIDIKDVQFVFGRFGSECTAPIPPQVPQTPVDP